MPDIEQHYRTAHVCSRLSVSRSTLARLRRETGCGPSVVISATLKLWTVRDIEDLRDAMQRRTAVT